jgi:hypothetical protein
MDKAPRPQRRNAGLLLLGGAGIYKPVGATNIPYSYYIAPSMVSACLAIAFYTA